MTTQDHRKLIRVAIPSTLNPVDIWEHTPVDYFGRGEYPRFLRPVGPRIGDFATSMRYRDELEKGHE